MFSSLFRRARRNDHTAPFLYGAIVARARTPALYSEIGVPDTVDGRFEMVVLHLLLVMRRLDTTGEITRRAGQNVFNLFCRDMDHSLRELGVSDLRVPKRMREVGEAYFGRAAAYEPGLAESDAGILAEAMRRTVFGEDQACEPARALAEYSVAAVARLAAQNEDVMVASGPDFPDVGTLPEKEGLT